MNSYIGSGLGKVIIINLMPGEGLLENIRIQLMENGVHNAVLLSAIGTLDKTVFHRVTTKDVLPKEEFITVEQPMELAALQGMVIDGNPHFHMVFSDLRTTYSGHLEEGTTVLYLAEIILAELKDVNLTRKKNQNNISLLKEK